MWTYFIFLQLTGYKNKESPRRCICYKHLVSVNRYFQFLVNFAYLLFVVSIPCGKQNEHPPILRWLGILDIFTLEYFLGKSTKL